MNIIIWLVVGGLVGWIASLLLGASGKGIVLNVVVGLIGAALGGVVMRAVGLRGSNINESFSGYSLLVSIGGAALLLLLLRVVKREART